jgi:hypothetical protein
VPQASRHPEVNQERAPGLESKNQILSAPIDDSDAFAFELGRDGERLERSDQSRIEDLDVLEAPTLERRRQLASDRLDFGKLRHGRG